MFRSEVQTILRSLRLNSTETEFAHPNCPICLKSKSVFYHNIATIYTVKTVQGLREKSTKQVLHYLLNRVNELT